MSSFSLLFVLGKSQGNLSSSRSRLNECALTETKCDSARLTLKISTVIFFAVHPRFAELSPDFLSSFLARERERERENGIAK